MKTQVISFNDFMTGEYKTAKKNKRIIPKIITSAGLPLIMATPFRVFAEEPAVTAGASEWLGEQTLQTLAHALDPLVDIMVALSFPIASVAMLGACFHFFFNNPSKAWSSMQNVGIGYVLIQLMPVILSILKAIGASI